jgi:hypothetical protein
MNVLKVLIVGIDPHLIDFTAPEFSAFPGLTASLVKAGINDAVSELNAKGYEAGICWIDFGETAAKLLTERLQQAPVDRVMIGAGIRVPVRTLLLFEQLVNVVQQYAPNARLCFNTHPGDTVAAVERWNESR